MQGLTAQSRMKAELVSAALAMKESVSCAGMIGELEIWLLLRHDPCRDSSGVRVHAEQQL